jgi:hypothetical protein
MESRIGDVSRVSLVSSRAFVTVTVSVEARMTLRRSPHDLAVRAAKALREKNHDGFRRETFALPREQARAKAREVFRRFPKPAYMTEVESWRELPDGRIEFTMRRLPTAD